MPQEDDFITVAGAARLAGVSQVTIRRWMDDPAVKVTKYRDGSGRVWADRKEIIQHITPVPVTGVGS
jgi:predicted site-specific integrase-resolvase